MTEKFEEPLLVTQASLPDYKNYIERIKTVWETKWITNQGPLHNELERELKEYLGLDNITLFCNGHLALDCAVKYLYHTYGGGEIITTPFTFVSTTHAISMNGFTPVFCDIKSTDYTIDEDKIEQLITDKTVAIVTTHVYGYPCNVSKINEIANKHGLKVIYDAAHAFGEEINGVPIGKFGDISMFSFHATKVFNTIEGGMLSFGDDKLKKVFDNMKNFGIVNAEEIDSFGLNAKMNEFQAAMGIENLKQTDKNIENRKKAVEVYYDRLSELPGMKLSVLNPNVKYNYAYMPVLIDEKEFGLTRDQLYEKLTGYNVFPRKYFYPLISNISVYSNLKAEVDTANYVSDRVLCLPLFGAIRTEDVEKVCDIITEVRGEAR